MFAERLKLARKAAKLSLRDLADAISHKVSAQAIGKYERGEMMPSSGVLLALAKALNVTLDFLLSPRGNIRLEGIEFRKLARATKKDLAQIKAEVLDQTDRYLQIEEIVDDYHEWHLPDGFPCKVNSIAQAETAADQLRQAWNLGDAPIPCLVAACEANGLKVLRLEDVPPTIDGLTCQVIRAVDDNAGESSFPVVACSADKGEERLRLSLAHEIGHMVMNLSPQLTAKEREKACHRFAGALLVPERSLKEYFGADRHQIAYRELMDAKEQFGVSAAALLYRLKDLEIISEARMRSILMREGRTWRSSEPEPMTEDVECPRRFKRLCLRALAEGQISMPRAVELLRMKPSEVRKQLDGKEG